VEIVGRTYGPTGKGMGAAALRDITQRKVAERQCDLFAQTEKLRAIGQLASGAAHDLNQLLGLTVGHREHALTTLSQTGHDGETLPESLRMIHQSAMDGVDTVKRLQTFARPRQETPLEQFDVGVVLRDVAQLTAPRWRDAPQAEGRPISLYVDVEDGLRVEG